MKIQDAIDTIVIEQVLRRTPNGRAISDNGIAAIDATVADAKNYTSNAIKCLNCGIILSSLVVPNGCPNCNIKMDDMTTNITGQDLWNK